MREIPSEIAVQVEHKVREVVEAVRAKGDEPIELNLNAFHGERTLFFNTVWYIVSHGKRATVTIFQRPTSSTKGH